LTGVKSPLLALLFALLPWPCASETQGGLNSESLAEVLEEVRAKHDVPALGAAIVTEDGPVLIEVVGVRKRGDKTKAEKGDMFHLGSCTKAFTGWLAGWAVENGKLRWDSKLSETFPRESRKWSAQHKQITLEQLLTHRAGFHSDASVEIPEQLPKGLDHWPRQ
jgi:D-alanyl-D-alanine carboxypeptidase